MKVLTRAEFKERFGTATERRVELQERFDEWFSAVSATGALRRVWVFGSYASSKPGPGDLDVLAQLASDFDTSNLPPSLREWLDHELCRELHEMDVFLCKEDTPEFVLDLILGTFGQDRSGQETIVEIIG
jgi:predicted nucleotidyltransferase